MVRKKPPEKQFKVKYVPALASVVRCKCKGTGKQESEMGGVEACSQCGGNGFLAVVWEVHVAA